MIRVSKYAGEITAHHLHAIHSPREHNATPVPLLSRQFQLPFQVIFIIGGPWRRLAILVLHGGIRSGGYIPLCFGLDELAANIICIHGKSRIII